MAEHQSLRQLVQAKIDLIRQRGGSQLATDLRKTIIDCLKALQTNCPHDRKSIAERKVLIKNVYDLLIQRVKTGFKFDQAPSAPSSQLHYLTIDRDRSISKLLERERERERE